jgi:hypothetical protein
MGVQFNKTDPPNEDVERGTFPEKWGRWVLVKRVAGVMLYHG